MSEIKNKALEKMLTEMNEKHSDAEDTIHNWLCDQVDDTLFQGILKEGRTIKGAMQYCTTQAAKQKSGNVAMVSHETVFGWVWKYFTDEKIPKNLNKVKTKVVASKPKKVVKKKEAVEKLNGEQLDLLSFL